MPTDPCPNHEAVVRQGEQYGAEIRELLISNVELKADVRNLTYEFGKFEKTVTTTLCELRADLQTQREADVNRDVKAATQEARTSFLWKFFVDKNGLIILGILAYVVLGKVI